MVDFRRRPFPEGMQRTKISTKRRAAASDYSSQYAAIPTELNADEEIFQEEGFPSNFTKGLPHNEFGMLETRQDYVDLTNKINQQDADNFDQVNRGINETTGARSRRSGNGASSDGSDITWRGWESPRAGHYFNLQGPDADAVGMPPAPELGTEELTAEMAEVYALALLRDVPFAQISANTGADAQTGITSDAVLTALESLSWFSDSSDAGLTLQQRRRRAARRVDHGPAFDINNPPDAATFDRASAFRGSAPAAKAGPYVSQFMLSGNKLTPSAAPHTDSSIAYGRQVIDQQIETLEPGTDFMLHWNAYLDVQNGANFTGDTDKQVVDDRRFITTPRDLAAYVRYDALYQAYLNACLYMLGDSTHFQVQQPVDHPYTGIAGPGFPDGNRRDAPDTPESRQAFATFGGPHILSLVTEVATRCLKAVRRQKFNYHRRARPERIGALLTLLGTKDSPNNQSDQLGTMSKTQISLMFNQLLDKDESDPESNSILGLVSQHNQSRLSGNTADPHLSATASPDPDWFNATENYLLPMAFAEGSPMHPSYGAGHATVAGGCVTMLKAFFNTTDVDGNSLAWPTTLPVLEANPDGTQLTNAANRDNMTISGELNKLAANISIGRNMAGVHYYTDYYESLRMGERVATGILIEQMKHYNEPVEFSFESFDGDFVHILKNDFDGADPRVFVHRMVGGERIDVGLDNWWNRHLQEDEVQDFILQFANRSKAELA